MKQNNFYFWLFILSSLFICLNLNISSAVAEEIPTIYKDLYLVPFSDTNPAPIEEPAPPKPQPTPTKNAPVQKVVAPSTKTQPPIVQAKTEPVAPTVAETKIETAVTSTIETAVTSTNELTKATATPILVEPIKPSEQLQAIVKKIADATADNKIIKNLPTPRSVQLTAEGAKRQLNLSLWLFLLVGLSATVINELVKKIHEHPSRFNNWWRNKTGHWHSLITSRPLIRKLLVVGGLLFYGVLIVLSETPDTFSAGLTSLVPVLAVVTVFLLIKEGGEKIFLARSGAYCWLTLSGLEVLFLTLGVLLSRNINLLPPLILSAPLALTVLKSSEAKEEVVKIKAIILTLVAVAIFWLSSYFNQPIWRGAALLVCAVGIQDIFFNLIPLNPLPGYALFKNRLKIWLVLFILATTGFVFLIIAPNSSSGNLKISWPSVAIYAGVALAIWLSLKMNSRRNSAD